MYLLVLGSDLMSCGESLSGVCIIQTEGVSAFLHSFHPGLFLYLLD